MIKNSIYRVVQQLKFGKMLNKFNMVLYLILIWVTIEKNGVDTVWMDFLLFVSYVVSNRVLLYV